MNMEKGKGKEEKNNRRGIEGNFEELMYPRMRTCRNVAQIYLEWGRYCELTNANCNNWGGFREKIIYTVAVSLKV